MKELRFVFVIAFVSMNLIFNLQAQEKNNRKKTLKIKMVKVENGKEVKIDTSFVVNEGEEIQAVLKRAGLEMDEMKHISIEDNPGKTVVWITAGVEDNHDKAVKKVVIMQADSTSAKQKVVVITGEDVQNKSFDFTVEDDDSLHDVFIFKPSVGGSVIYKSTNDDFFTSNQSGMVLPDNVKPGDTVRIKTIISVNGKESVEEKEIIVDEDLSDKNKKSAYAYLTKTDNFDKQMDKSVFVLSSRNKTLTLNISDAGKKDLKNIKIPKSYKKLNLKITLQIEDNKTVLSFNVPQKANTGLSVFDTNGKIVFKENKKDFSGNFRTELPDLNGEFILQIVQGKKYAFKKLRIKTK